MTFVNFVTGAGLVLFGCACIGIGFLAGFFYNAATYEVSNGKLVDLDWIGELDSISISKIKGIIIDGDISILVSGRPQTNPFLLFGGTESVGALLWEVARQARSSTADSTELPLSEGEFCLGREGNAFDGVLIRSNLPSGCVSGGCAFEFDQKMSVFGGPCLVVLGDDGWIVHRSFGFSHRVYKGLKQRVITKYGLGTKVPL